MRVTTTLSKGYQITLPSALRKALKLESGDEIVLEQCRDGILLKKALTREEKVRRSFAELAKWRESLPDEVKENIKKHAGWTVNQYHEYYDNLPETKTYLEEKYGVKTA